MKNTLFIFFAVVAICPAQITVPEGTKIRVRLEQTVSSATVETGATIEFAVTQGVEIGGIVAISEGARVTGTVIQAVERRRMGRSGKFDFSIDRVLAVDGKWIPLRYSPTKAKGEGRGVTTGVLTAGIAVVFWPAAPLALLVKGKDITVHKGTIYEVFSDENVLVSGVAPGAAKANARGLFPANPAQSVTAANTFAEPSGLAVPASYQVEPALSDGVATVTITSSRPGADIEVDGVFVGSTPSTVKLPAGLHQIKVSNQSQLWQRTLRVTAGSAITLEATGLAKGLPVRKAGLQ